MIEFADSEKRKARIKKIINETWRFVIHMSQGFFMVSVLVETSKLVRVLSFMGVAEIPFSLLSRVIIAVIFMAVFVIYELTECLHHLNDGAYIDLRGTMGGIVGAFLLYCFL